MKKYSVSSEIQLLKVGRISKISENFPNPRQDFVSGAPKSVHPKATPKDFKKAVTFFLREISELNGSRYLIFGTHHRMYLIVCQKLYIF